MPRGKFGVCGDHALGLLPLEDLIAHRVPPGVERALIPVRPLLRHVMRRVACTRGEVREERLVGHQSLLLMDPPDRLIRKILREVVALLRSLGGIDGAVAFVQGGVVLIRLARNEAVEVLEADSARRPRIEGPHRRRQVRGDLVALAEHGCGVSVVFQRQRQRRLRIGNQGVVPRRRRCELGHHPESNGVVVAPVKERRPRRSTQRRCVEPVVGKAILGKAVGDRGVDQSTERTRGTEAHVVQQDHQHVRGSLGWPQRLDGRIRRVRVLCVERRVSRLRYIRNGKHRPGCARRWQRIHPFDRCLSVGPSCSCLLSSAAVVPRGREFAFAGARTRG